MAPDWLHRGCCVAHDVDYYWGGDWKERFISDVKLGLCVSERYHSSYGWLVGFVYFLFPRLFGGPYWPKKMSGNWQWGYGHEEGYGKD